MKRVFQKYGPAHWRGWFGARKRADLRQRDWRKLGTGLLVLALLSLSGCREKTASPDVNGDEASVTAEELNPSAGGVLLRQRGEHGRQPAEMGGKETRPLQSGEAMLISFPRPMVTAAEFDKPGAVPPVEFKPAVRTEFVWKSATEGELTVQGPLAPATPYRIQLRSDLKDRDGGRIDAPGWGREWTPAQFRASVSTDGMEVEALPVQPHVTLSFTHPVAASEVARTAVWRDDLGRKIESEVTVSSGADGRAARHFGLTPMKALEPGRTYELIVEDTPCALGGIRLPFVHVFPIGKTRPLTVEWVRARHQPVIGTFLEVRFDQSLIQQTTLRPGALQITPAAKIVGTEINGPDLWVYGEFQPGVRYTVELARDAVEGRRGFGLAQKSTWHATFGAKRAAVILPQSIITTPAAQGVEVGFVQVNTGRLHWQLARIPVGQLVAVRRRLDEYRRLEADNRDPHTNEMRMAPTTLLIPDLKLPVVTSGEFESSGGDREEERTLRFEAQQMVGGAYLLEVAGAAADGRVAGNRALILVNREFLVWKTDRAGMHARLFDLASGEPVAGAKIRVIGADGRLLAEGESNAAGEFSPRLKTLRGSPLLILVERDGGQSAHFTEFSGPVPWDTSRAASHTSWRQWLFTDRGIYRPGETMHVKGIMRLAKNNVLTLPATQDPVAWQIRRRSDSEPVLTGESTLSATGAWEAEIALPATLPLGTYAICVGEQQCDFKLDEFRAPAFAVELHAPEKSPDRTSRVRVISHYFHGAPNAQALVRWRAVWSSYATFIPPKEKGPYLATTDYYSPDLELQRSPSQALGRWRTGDEEARSLTCEGTAVLDANGTAEIESSPPFPPHSRLAAADVRWEISVVAPDGQTVSAGGGQRVPLAKAQPAVALSNRTAGEIVLDVSAVDLDAKAVAGTPLSITLYHVAEKTVRENVARHVVRYQNTPVATSVLTREVKAAYHETIRVAHTGRFVAVVELAKTAASPRASAEVIVTGKETAEFAQWDDRSVTLSPDKPRYDVGETAHVAVRAPVAGRAWVTVETDRILQSFDVALPGNAAAVDIPITKAMHPNAYVNVYLYRPQGAGEPAERMGLCDLQVRRPETELQIELKLNAPKIEPGETVRGTMAVTSEAKPAANAEVTLFAVDEAILRYGQWELPDPDGVFFPPRSHDVSTRSGLQEFKPRREDEALFQKGFLIGDGSLGWRSRFVRSRFLPLAFWQGSARTDAAGNASFQFTAPDNLTEYRIVAVAHEGTDAFGSGSQPVQVARKLQAEPALPRFVRAGDKVELRVVLRQNGWAELPIEAGCVLEGATLATSAVVEKSLARALPQPVVFTALVDKAATRLRVRFTVRAKETKENATADDAVEIELPVRPARILRHETVAGVVPAAGWSPLSARPDAWREAEGQVDVIVSSSPWLPLLDGLPALLEYPHGCVEQLSSRVLAYAMMADLLRALPDGEARAPEYRRRVEEGLTRLARAQLADGNMPYWPGSKGVHPFATVQTAWAVVEARRSGWTIAPSMTERLRAALLRIVRRQDGVRESPTLRAFALRVAAALEVEPKPRVEALELYQERDALGDDGRAFLALALHEFQILPEEKRQLVAELEREPAERAFEPATFGSTARTAALRLCARATIAAASCTEDECADRRRALTALMGSSQNFSTQENLWLLLAFRALARSEGTARAVGWELPFPSPMRSADGCAVGWFARSLADFESQFAGKAAGSGDPALHPAQRDPTLRLGGGTGSFLLRATYRTSAAEARVDRGFRIERVVHNLTAPKRDGSAEAPFQLGDELAVTFRVLTDRAQAYVALEESLPAAFETVDPDYYRGAQRGRAGDFEADGLALSHWEKRDDRTLWYFDRMGAGTASYTAIVRVTSAGMFQWPGAAIAPMYDARFSGVSEGRTIWVR